MHKLSNPVLVNFLEEYTGRVIPDQSTIRKNYLQEAYENTLLEIRTEIGDAPVWITIDETTDKEGR